MSHTVETVTAVTPTGRVRPGLSSRREGPRTMTDTLAQHADSHPHRGEPLIEMDKVGKPACYSSDTSAGAAV